MAFVSPTNENPNNKKRNKNQQLKIVIKKPIKDKKNKEKLSIFRGGGG